MGKYHPGTLDPELVIARRDRSQTRVLHSISGPSGSQMRGTSSRVAELAADFNHLLDSVRKEVFGIGYVMSLKEDVSPTAKGYPGNWQKFGTLTTNESKTIYLYERIADG